MAECFVCMLTCLVRRSRRFDPDLLQSFWVFSHINIFVLYHCQALPCHLVMVRLSLHELRRWLRNGNRSLSTSSWKRCQSFDAPASAYQEFRSISLWFSLRGIPISLKRPNLRYSPSMFFITLSACHVSNVNPNPQSAPHINTTHDLHTSSLSRMILIIHPILVLLDPDKIANKGPQTQTQTNNGRCAVGDSMFCLPLLRSGSRLWCLY